ncbi:MAG: hypothetical protein RLZZ505_333 [Verrucomicrobiota bacterium]|jgi:hypothetical protein
MKLIRPILRFLLCFIGIYVLLCLLILFVQLASPPFSGNDLILGRFFTGFWHFLVANLPAISWNAATWGPGLGAFLIAVVFVHRWLSRWASRTGRPWSFMTSFCIVSLVPVLFVIAFLVPGVLLQWEMLRETAWVEIR